MAWVHLSGHRVVRDLWRESWDLSIWDCPRCGEVLWERRISLPISKPQYEYFCHDCGLEFVSFLDSKLGQPHSEEVLQRMKQLADQFEQQKEDRC